MEYTRRDLGKLALALPGAALLSRSGPALAAAAQAARPNSRFSGVQIGTITYSYRSMPDQSAEATLKYILASGISAVELMGGPVNAYARARSPFTPGSAPGAEAGGARAGGGGAGGGRGGRGAADPATLTAEWNGVKCAPGAAGADPVMGSSTRQQPAPAVAGVAAAGAAALLAQTPEQSAARQMPQLSRSGAWASRWTSSRICGRCTTTPASASTPSRTCGRAATRISIHVCRRRGARRQSHHARIAERPERRRDTQAPR